MESAQVRSDPGGRSLRMVALVSGTLGLVVVGVLAVMVTPNREESPLAVQTEPSFVEPISLGPTTSALIDLANELTTALGMPRPDAGRTTIASLVGTSPTPGSAAALATPFDAGMAIVTIKSIAGSTAGDEVSVRLASGRTFEAEVLATLGNAAVVAIGALLSDERAHSVADEVPGDDTMVTVMLATPTSVRLAELASIGAPEGTAVVDSSGRLIGLCTEDAEGHTSLAPAVDADEPEPTASGLGTITPAATTTVPATVTTSSVATTITTVVTTSSTVRSTSTSTSTTSTTSTLAPSGSAAG